MPSVCVTSNMSKICNIGKITGKIEKEYSSYATAMKFLG